MTGDRRVGSTFLSHAEASQGSAHPQANQRVQRTLRRLIYRMPGELAAYGRTLTGAAVGFLILTTILAAVSPIKPIYSLPVLGMLFAAQATMYKWRLGRDPEFLIPDCGCARPRTDDTAAVLTSGYASLFGLPNCVLAVGFYATVLATVMLGHPNAALGLSIGGVMLTAYLAYVMAIQLKALCQICINISAINLLILFSLWVTT